MNLGANIVLCLLAACRGPSFANKIKSSILFFFYIRAVVYKEKLEKQVRNVTVQI